MTETERRAYIGGSDLSDILALPPYGCQRRAWENKRDPIEWEGNAHTERGTKLEAVAAAEYTERTGRKLRRMGLVKSAIHPELAGHLDRHIVALDERGPGVLEIKCPSVASFSRLRREGLPQGYIAQLQWYMELTGWEWGSFAVFSAERWEMDWWDVAYDPAIAHGLLRTAVDFLRMIENGPAPAALEPKARPCQSCRYHERCHGVEAPPADFTGDVEQIEDAELESLCEQRDELRTIEGEANEARVALDDAIKARVGEGRIVRAGRWRVTNYRTKRKGYTVAEGTTSVFRIIGRDR